MNATVLSTARPNLVFSSLDAIGKRSKDILDKGKFSRFLEKAKDAQEVANLVEQLRITITYYQVSGSDLV